MNDVHSHGAIDFIYFFPLYTETSAVQIFFALRRWTFLTFCIKITAVILDFSTRRNRFSIKQQRAVCLLCASVQWTSQDETLLCYAMLCYAILQYTTLDIVLYHNILYCNSEFLKARA